MLCWLNIWHCSLKRVSHSSAFYLWCSWAHMAHANSVWADCASPLKQQSKNAPNLTSPSLLCVPSCRFSLKLQQRLKAIANPPFFVFVPNTNILLPKLKIKYNKICVSLLFVLSFWEYVWMIKIKPVILMNGLQLFRTISYYKVGHYYNCNTQCIVVRGKNIYIVCNINGLDCHFML